MEIAPGGSGARPQAGLIGKAVEDFVNNTAQQAAAMQAAPAICKRPPAAVPASSLSQPPQPPWPHRAASRSTFLMAYKPTLPSSRRHQSWVRCRERLTLQTSLQLLPLIPNWE
jgi:hypothetical protein